MGEVNLYTFLRLAGANIFCIRSGQVFLGLSPFRSVTIPAEAVRVDPVFKSCTLVEWLVSWGILKGIWQNKPISLWVAAVSPKVVVLVCCYCCLFAWFMIWINKAAKLGLKRAMKNSQIIAEFLLQFLLESQWHFSFFLFFIYYYM